MTGNHPHGVVQQIDDVIGAGYLDEAMGSVFDLLDHAVVDGYVGMRFDPRLAEHGEPVDDELDEDYRAWLQHLRGLIAGYGETFTFADEEGENYLLNVHRASTCSGQQCVIHRPSGHEMSSWPLLWEQESKRFMRTCPHGVRHPDPDQFDFWSGQGRYDVMSVHACDSCCPLVQTGWTAAEARH